MGKIKNIHCFGTSFTAGGGFEWEGYNSDRTDDLEKIYGHLNIPKNQWSYSWPGRFKDILNKNNLNINVYNHAKQGYGNQRIYRKIFEVLLSKNFNKEENLFIIEFSWLNRREFYLNDINDYIICNYGIGSENEDGSDEKLMHVELASSYFYDEQPVQKMLYGDTEVSKKIFDFLSLTLNSSELEKEVNRNISMLISFLNYHNINYYISSTPPIHPEYNHLIQIDRKKIIEYKYNDVVGDYFESFIEPAGLSIYDETNNKYDDFHAGVFGNTLIASQIYNKIVENGDIDSEYVNPIPEKINLNI